MSTARTRLERELDPEAIRQLKAQATHDITVGGADLAGQALQAGLVDECHLLPVARHRGRRHSAFPAAARIGLELLDERRFGNGVVHLHYRVTA